jgi:hypothetical protein
VPKKYAGEKDETVRVATAVPPMLSWIHLRASCQKGIQYFDGVNHE